MIRSGHLWGLGGNNSEADDSKPLLEFSKLCESRQKYGFGRGRDEKSMLCKLLNVREKK